MNSFPSSCEKRVVIYQDGLLSYSETFIKQQALGLTSWSPILLGHKYQSNSLDFSMLPSQLLVSNDAPLWMRIRYNINRWYNKADPEGIRTLKALKPNLIHAHFGTSATDIWPYAKELNIPMLVTLHGFDIRIYREWWEAGKRGQRKKKYPKLLLSLAREKNVHFLAVSTAIRNRAIEFGIPAEKITLNYIGVDTDYFTPGATSVLDRPNRIVYVGRLVEKKGSPYLLDAFAKVKERVSDAELVIIGEGGLENALKEKTKTLKLRDVEFVGAQTSEQVREHINNSRIFCLPSITAEDGDAEGLPISILEAQASGVFVVTSSSGGVGDNIHHEETCFYFEEKNVDQLADQLTTLLRKPQDYSHVIDNQLRLISQKFTLKHCAAELEKLYTQFSRP